MKFIFHHIPKAGGCSFRKAMQEAGFSYKKAEFYRALTDDAAWIKQHDNVQLLSSHYLFRAYDGPRAYVTWIRDPVDMFYSGYYWYTRHSPGRFYWPTETLTFMQNVMWQQGTIREYVDDVLANDYEFAFPRKLFDLNWPRFDFIGVTGQQRSIDAFNQQFGTNIKLLHANRTRSRPSQKKDYRREEVAELLKKETAIYEGLKQQWLGLGQSQAAA